MSNLRQAAQQALEFCEFIDREVLLTDWADMQREAVEKTLRAALAEPEQDKFCDSHCTWRDHHPECVRAEPEQEPVAHLWQHSETGRTRVVMPDEVWTASNSWAYVGPLCLGAAPTPRKPEPSAVKHMMQWVDVLKRLSDDGQHMNIPGLSSGACWELAAELEQFIKSTAPTPRKPLPLTDEEIVDIWADVSIDQDDQINIIELGRAVIAAYEAKQRGQG